jgi:hypothetical protein
MDGDPLAVRATRYRQRAIEARAEAEKMSDPENRRSLLDVALSYERLAHSFEPRVQGVALLPE